MAVELRCPDCGSRLRLPTAPEPGTEVECPKCTHVFTARAPEDDADERPRKKARDEDAEDRPREEGGVQTKTKKKGKGKKKADDNMPKRKRAKKKETNPMVLVFVSIFGMINTLVLSVYERTREIGMLRAIGMTRRQVRRMIRHESVITALIGAAVGIVLGIILAALLIWRVDFLVFDFPTTQVVVFVFAAILVGILAAIFPARRAARLDPLEAISYE